MTREEMMRMVESEIMNATKGFLVPPPATQIYECCRAVLSTMKVDGRPIESSGDVCFDPDTGRMTISCDRFALRDQIGDGS